MTIRIAEPADLDRVVAVALVAMPGDPQWNYRFPHRHIHWDDHEMYTKLLFQDLIDSSYDDWLVMVAETPSQADSRVANIVAFAVWDISYENKRRCGANYHPRTPMQQVVDMRAKGGCGRKDANPRRMAAFRNECVTGKQRFFGGWGQNQIHLQILGTHPEYRRRGFGTKLVQWGMDTAERERLALTVMASPMGSLLYSHLEFKSLGNRIVQVTGEEEKVRLEAMVFESRTG